MKHFRTGAVVASAALALTAGIVIAQTPAQDTGAGTQPDAATRGQSGPSTGTTGANAPTTNTTDPAATSSGRNGMPRSQADTGRTNGSAGMRSDPSMTISRAPRNDRG